MRANLNALLPWVRVRNIYSTNESGDNAIADSDGRFRVMTDVAFEVLDPISLTPVPAGVMGALVMCVRQVQKSRCTSVQCCCVKCDRAPPPPEPDESSSDTGDQCQA